MLPTTLNSINEQLKQWTSIDLAQLVGEHNPDSKLSDLNFADLDGKNFINLSSRVVKQFTEEFEHSLAICYPSTFEAIHLTSPDSNQSYTLLSVIQNFITYAQAGNFNQASRHLKVLVSYQMMNGFWDRSERKVHHPGSIGVSDIIEELSALKAQTESTPDNFRKEITQLKGELETLETNVSEIPHLHTKATTSEAQITELHTDAEAQLELIKAALTAAGKEESAIEASRKTIDQFTQKITDRESQLEKQEKATQDYLTKLETLQNEHSKNVANLQAYESEQKKLIENLNREATLALELNTARGLSREFQTKATALKPTLGFKLFAKNSDETKKRQFITPYGNGSGWWLIGSGIFVTIAILIALALIAAKVAFWGVELEFQNDVWHQMLGRISVVGLLVTAAIYCAKQFSKDRNLYEDYAYRQILTSSLPAFLSKLEDFEDSDTMGAKYLQQVLEEVKTHPTREPIAPDKTSSSPKLEKDQIDLVKTVITALKNK